MIEPMALLIGMTRVGNGDPLLLPSLVTKQGLTPASMQIWLCVRTQ